MNNRGIFVFVFLGVSCFLFSNCSNIFGTRKYPKNYNCGNLKSGESSCLSGVDTCRTPKTELLYECGSLVFDLNEDSLYVGIASEREIHFMVTKYFKALEAQWTQYFLEKRGMKIDFSKGEFEECLCDYQIYIYKNDALTPLIIEEAGANAANHGPRIHNDIELNYIFNIEGHVPEPVQDWIRENKVCEGSSVGYLPTQGLKGGGDVRRKVRLKYKPGDRKCRPALQHSNGQKRRKKIAILDTGIDDDLLPGNTVFYQPFDNHKCLEDDDSGWNFVDSTNTVGDDHGHGTIVALSYLHALERLGVNYDEQSILPVKVMDSCGVGTLFNITCGIYYAKDKEVDVINLSLGAYLDSSNILKQAIGVAVLDSIAVVCSAGNNGRELPPLTDPDHFPSCFSRIGSGINNQLVFEVGALCLNPLLIGCSSQDETVWPESNRAFGMFMESGIHYELILQNLVYIPLPGGESIDGTSFATPVFSAAMLKEGMIDVHFTQSECIGLSIPVVTGKYISYLQNNVNCKY